MSATPNIAIVEYLPPTQIPVTGTGGGTYVIRNRYAMPRSDTLYLDLEQELIKQSLAFKLARGWVDKQPGAQTVERVRLAGHYNFEGKSFKENVDVPTVDASGRIMLEKQPLKHAMIFLMRRLLEQGRLVFAPMAPELVDQGDFTSYGEEIHQKGQVFDETLEKIIRSYQIVKVTPRGTPEYTGVGDHPLMALFLALFAAYELFDDPFSITMPGEVVVSSVEQVPALGGTSAETLQTNGTWIDPAKQYVSGYATEFSAKYGFGSRAQGRSDPLTGRRTTGFGRRSSM